MKLEIAEARSEIMAPLSAASMESYSRAYPYLVKLHMLQVSALITFLALALTSHTLRLSSRALEGIDMCAAEC